MSGDHTGIGFCAFVAIVVSLVAFWFGVLGLFFYGALNDSTGMIVTASILSPIPCIAIIVMKWREVHHRYSMSQSLLHSASTRLSYPCVGDAVIGVKSNNVSRSHSIHSVPSVP